MKKYWYSLEQKMIELRNFCFHFGASIYMFHQINDNKDLWEDDAVSISRKGFEEFIESGNLCIIEWPEKIEQILPSDTLRVKISVLKDGSRELAF